VNSLVSEVWCLHLVENHEGGRNGDRHFLNLSSLSILALILNVCLMDFNVVEIVGRNSQANDSNRNLLSFQYDCVFYRVVATVFIKILNSHRRRFHSISFVLAFVAFTLPITYTSIYIMLIIDKVA